MGHDGQFLTLSLSIAYGKRPPIFRDFCLEMRRGEILGLVGGSGCGKSTLALAILRLLDTRGATVSGSINFNGRDLLSLSERQMRHVRGREIGLVLQSPMSSLNPMLRIGRQMREAWRAHRPDSSGEAEIATALRNVDLPHGSDFLKRYPSEISVGQAQRVLIAMAILHGPGLLIADEPTSALDAITQIGALELFRSINKQSGNSILLISHDLAAVESICDRIAVLYEGKIVECHASKDMVSLASHPYTQALFQGRARASQETHRAAAASTST
ncbi:MAG: ABC transporter ATP-binding protein [Acidobacteriales bacterium]|nr:ABC transporter ATP-binding protein [Terriglobales bacterium]